MRARPPPADTAVIAAQFEAAPGVRRMRAAGGSGAASAAGFGAASAEIVAAVLEEAGRFAETWLVPLNDGADAPGCTVQAGPDDAPRVRTAPGHRAAWSAFVQAGWTTLDHPEAIGGQGLPLALCMAVQEIFDRACPAFGMLPVPQRSAARLIAAFGSAAIRAEWLPPLVGGSWGATICISEAQAGSDVGAIRTRAEPLPDGDWAITGEKCWISFGDHDLTPRIGHCLLARTPGAAPGGAGLSLFLVPDMLDDGRRNGVTVRRIEHKMGLNGSPTCALGFERARGRLIGVEAKGLAQMFVMIANMRLSVGAQGLGIAAGAADMARDYAQERRQGGPAGAPVPIICHADVAGMILQAQARVETVRGLLLGAANFADIAAFHPDTKTREEAQALTQWLLPIVKTAGGECAIEVASAAIQVLGGAGYTRDWPVEQAARDARVLTVYEGTTGMQALDLVRRRLLHEQGRGMDAFMRESAAEAAGCAAFAACRGHLQRAAAMLAAAPDAAIRDAGATAFLHLASLAATGWIAVRLSRLAEPGLAAAGASWLWDIEQKAALLARQVAIGRAGGLPV